MLVGHFQLYTMGDSARNFSRRAKAVSALRNKGEIECFGKPGRIFVISNGIVETSLGHELGAGRSEVGCGIRLRYKLPNM